MTYPAEYTPEWHTDDHSLCLTSTYGGECDRSHVAENSYVPEPTSTVDADEAAALLHENLDFDAPEFLELTALLRVTDPEEFQRVLSVSPSLRGMLNWALMRAERAYETKGERFGLAAMPWTDLPVLRRWLDQVSGLV